MSYKSWPIEPPWLGQISEVPATETGPGGFDEVTNFFCVRGRLQTRPKLNTFVSAPDGLPIYLMRSYKDVNGSLHTLVVTTKTAYHLTDAAGTPTLNALNFPAGVTDLSSTNRPFGVAAVLNRVYFSNGETKVLYADGSDTLKIAGDVPGGARFLAVIGGHLVLAFVKESSTNYSNRIRWSAIGVPNSYEHYTAGSTNLFEVPDDITGAVGASRSGFIFRTNGLTMVTATGVAVAPLAFENFATEPEGVGNVYPYSLAAYGNRFVVFVADDDIYKVLLPEFVPIGGLARKAIFDDIALANGPIVGKIVPNLGVGYPFLSYWLSIPKASNSVTWVYSLSEQSWTRFVAAGALTSLSTVYIV